MKATRRGFFGGMVGAAVAGPSLVKQAAAQALSGGASNGLNSAIGLGSAGYTTAVNAAYDHGTWLRDRVKQLRGMSADERREAILRMGWDLDLAEVSTLRSVSDRQKMAMLAERRFERQRSQELSSLLRELAGLEGKS